MPEPYTVADMTDPDKERLFTIEYLLAIGVARDRPHLVAAVKPYLLVFPDAYKLVLAMDSAGFNRFRTGLLMELGGRPAGEEWVDRFGPIYIPANTAIISTWMDLSGTPFTETLVWCLAEEKLVIGPEGQLCVGYPPGVISGDGAVAP